MSNKSHDKELSLAQASRNFDAARHDLATLLWKRINHNRFLIACVQGLSRALAWIGGHRDG